MGVIRGILGLHDPTVPWWAMALVVLTVAFLAARSMLR